MAKVWRSPEAIQRAKDAMKKKYHDAEDNGLCPKCHTNKSVDGKKLCPECRRKQQEQRAKWKEKNQEQADILRLERQKACRCIICGEPAFVTEDGSVSNYCERHYNYRITYNKTYKSKQEQYVSEGRCYICGAPATRSKNGKLLKICERHRGITAGYRKKRKEEGKDAKRPPQDLSGWRAKRKEEGRCMKCGAETDFKKNGERYTECPECRKKDREKYLERKALKNKQS